MKNRSAIMTKYCQRCRHEMHFKFALFTAPHTNLILDLAIKMAPVKIALDWKPNGNHVGFYVAKAKGIYSAAGLDVSLISPHSDNYTATPASRVESGEALLAITPSETVISFNTRPPSMPKPAIKAVATLLQRDDSAIVTLKSSGIDKPAKLDGKRYASYGARYEGRIVQQMIKADGGTGDYQELALPMLGLWETVLKEEADATWVFMGWEGVEAKLKGVELNVFKLGDYGIPYGYSPVVVAHPDAITGKKEELAKVLNATAEGFAFAAAHPEEAAELMAKAVAEEHPDLPMDLDVLKGSVAVVAGACQNAAGKWGHMEADRWSAFLDWLSSNGLLTSKVQTRGESGADTTSLDGLRSGDVGDVVPRDSVNAENLFTNEFLPKKYLKNLS
jgi:ABC-type nitrate/sulfonate/bicarbonate transport system substrate-binding protein